MSKYLVSWEIDIEDVDNPISAAQEAKCYQIKPDTTTNVFNVKNKKTGEITIVDLDDLYMGES